MGGDLADKVLNSLCFKPSEQVPDLKYELFAENVDSGIAEILYRLLPGPGFVVLPASTANFIYTFATKKFDLAERDKETAKFTQVLYDKVQKGRVALIPIQSGGHWTLLALERKSESAGSAGTTATNPLGSTDPVRRGQAEAKQFDVDSWPNLPKNVKEEWQVRYYDSFSPSIMSCQECAVSILSLLEAEGFGKFPGSLLPPKNKLFQEGHILCGYYLLHYIEEETRAYLGECRGTMHLDLDYRLERINAMQAAFTFRVKAKAKAKAGSK